MFEVSHVKLCCRICTLLFIVFVSIQAEQLDDFLEPNMTATDRNIMNTHYNTLVKQPKKINGLFANSTHRTIEPIIFVPG